MGGVERNRAIANEYYKGLDGIIFIYDVCDENSFKCIPNWFKQAKKKVKMSVVKFW